MDRMTPHIKATEIPVGTGDVLAGQLWGDSRDWVILVHDVGEDLDMWAGLPARLAGQGFTVLAIDLRGHGGSTGEPDIATIDVDLEAALDYAHRSAARTAMLVVAGAAASAGLSACAAHDVIALALIAPYSIDPTVPRPPVATLAVVPSDGTITMDEQTGTSSVRELQTYGGGFTVVAHVPGAGRPVELLAGSWGTHCEEWIARFLVDSLTAHVQRRRDMESRRSTATEEDA